MSVSPDNALATASVPTSRAVVRALRVEHWMKNLLLFVPLLLARQAFQLPLYERAIVGFLAFSLCASAVYVLNDLMDVEADRRHAIKRMRPFATGDLSPAFGVVLGFVCVAVGAGFAVRLPPLFGGMLILYLAVTTMYTFWLKHVPLVDVVVLAMLYTGRVIAGGIATGVWVSPWLLGFSLFFFLSLAFVKRYAELHVLRMQESSLKTRGYYPSDLELVTTFGTVSGYLSVLVAALYINADLAQGIYRRPDLLWLVCPLLLYWVSRIWMLAHRGQLHEDPVLFAVRDRTSWLVGAAIVVVLLLARF